MDIRLSPIQFGRPVLQQCDFKINSDFSVSNDEPGNPKRISMPIHTEVNAGEAMGNEYPVSLYVQVGKEDSAHPFSISVSMAAIFYINKEVSNEQKKQFLSVNAPAVLYSYIRPVIASLTSQSAYPQYNLPFMDFTPKDDSKK